MAPSILRQKEKGEKIWHNSPLSICLNDKKDQTKYIGNCFSIKGRKRELCRT